MHKEKIGGVHLWGKDDTKYRKRDAHHGNLDTYFYGNKELKNKFLYSLEELFNDNITRNMVLEVNGDKIDKERNILSISEDLLNNGFIFN